MDSDSPVIFKRNKGKSSQRPRQTLPEDAVDTTGRLDSLSAKLKKRSKKQTRLSFGGDEEENDGDVFKVKKSSLSRKIGLGTHPAMALDLEKATISTNHGPSYDQAHLNELKASTPSARPKIATDPYDADTSLNIEDMSTMSMNDTENLNEAIIPTESFVKLAKEKRERIRKIGAPEEDYISLSVARRSETAQGPHPGSRLMREEDEVGEGDDEYAEYTSAQERIALGRKSRKLEATKLLDELKELIDDVEEDDEETAEWEQKQLRRSGHSPSHLPLSETKPTYKPASIPVSVPVPTLGSAMSRLTEQLTLLTTSHTNNTNALSNIAKECAEVADREKEMRDMISRAETKRAWFESFRIWVEALAGFLDEKYPLLEKLEEEHVSLLKERYEMIAARRQAEDEDDLSIIFGALPIPAPVSEGTDDLGQSVPQLSPTALKRQRREARLRRRQLRFERKNNDRPTEEGYSTDSSLPPHDQSSYESATTSLVKQTKDVMADVRAEEFLDPAKGKWGEWREHYSESYVGAWGGLGVVSVWEFWVRLEMVGWDCIEAPRALDTLKWYQGLYTYSRPGEDEDGDVGERELGPDGDLVASMITTAVIPRLAAVISGGALDPYSEVHIKRAVHLAEEVEASVEENSKLQILLKSVVTCFQAAITGTEALLEKFAVVKKRAPTFDPEAIPARQRFLVRCTKLLKTMLRWRRYTGEEFGIGSLMTRLVENCILEVAESGWEVGGESFARKIATMLPDELTPSRLKIQLGIK